LLTLLALDVGNVAKSVLGIGGLIFVHELGHFLVGRLCRVRAEAFSIGFGPVLAKWKPGETEYRLSAVPLGGYVKFLGENPDERGDRDPRSFFAATYPRKVAIMLAGVTMNVFAAFVLFVAAFSSGVEVIAPVIGAVRKDLPAANAGLLPGDRIVSIDGRRILEFEDVQQETAFADRVEIVYERGGQRAAPVTIQTVPSEVGFHMIGVEMSPDESGAVVPAEGSAAEKAGLRPLDRVVAVDGAPATTLAEAWEVHARSEKPTTWTLLRKGEQVRVGIPRDVFAIGVTPGGKEESDDPPPGLLIGVVTGPDAGPAAEAGLPPQLRVITLDGSKVAAFEDLRSVTRAAGEAGRDLVFRWTAPEGGEVHETRVRPRARPANGPSDVGIEKPPLRETVRERNVVQALGLGVDRTHRWIVRISNVLRSLFTGKVSARELQGPIGIARASYATADTGWARFFLFLGMISMNLAVLNVLPVPLLDGGQLALITAEKIRGKPLPERLLEGIQWTGLAVLLSFMLYVIVNDIRRL
jgi:regulator of sigma E protease